MIIKITPGVNFTNILLTAFTRTDPKSAKKDSQVKQLFVALGSACVKAVCKHVDEIDPLSQFHQRIGAKCKFARAQSLKQPV